MNTFTDDQKKSWLFLARKFKFFDTLVVIWPIIENKSVKTRWMILAPSQQASFVYDEEKISVIYWRLPGRFCTKSSLSMRWCGKQEAKRPCQRTTPHHRTSFEWFAVAVNDDELVRWRFFPKLLNLKETLQKILQPFWSRTT